MKILDVFFFFQKNNVLPIIPIVRDIFKGVCRLYDERVYNEPLN